MLQIVDDFGCVASLQKQVQDAFPGQTIDFWAFPAQDAWFNAFLERLSVSLSLYGGEDSIPNSLRISTTLQDII